MNAAPKLEGVPDDAETLLDLLAPGEPVTFQTFGEGVHKGAHGLNRVMHGMLAEHRQTLAALNARGAGVFWMVNAGDGEGRKASNVQCIRALFVDLDGARLEPVQASPLAPHAIVESSPNRWHAYWRISDCSLDNFAPLQKALAVRFAGDVTVHDLPRVLRLPGFVHRKGNPFASHIVALRDIPPYTLGEFRAALGFGQLTPAPATQAAPQRTRARRSLPDAIPEGERNATIFSLARGLVQRGYDAHAVNDRLQRINAERCLPPLGADEVDAIAAQASGYGSNGFAMLPHQLLDSRELNALPLPSRWIVVTAFRRYDGTSAGVALTHADCKDIPGCAHDKDFMRYRALAVDSGILECKRKGVMTRDGRTPNLYAVSPRFLPSLPYRTGREAHPYQIPPPYIDIQGKEKKGLGGGGARPKRGNER